MDDCRKLRFGLSEKEREISRLKIKFFSEDRIKIAGRSIRTGYFLGTLMLIGILVRVIELGVVPGGINQDEAFAGYEAFSLANYGMDSYGNPFPVYFVSWGSGMNVLNSYLMIPFVALFGVHAWTIRLPQVLVACVSLYVFYRMLYKLFGAKQALLGLFVFAICPWHIMMSRWGLESNLAPGFLLFGLYAFILGTEKSKYYIISAICYGLSLYCYATIWPVVPFLLFFQMLYLLWVKKFRFDRYVVIAIGVLAFMALPLVGFLLVNYGYIEEIKLPFLTIPELVVMRGSEISIHNLKENARNLCRMLWNQNDGLLWNSTEKFGLYYRFGTIVAVAGFFYSLYRTVVSLWKRKFDGHAMIMIQFLTAVLLGCLISANVNRINFIHTSMVAFVAIALYRGVVRIQKHFGKGAVAAGMVLAAGCLGFALFINYYFGEYNEEIKPMFQYGLEEAVAFAEEIREEDQIIYVTPLYSYTKILLLSEYPTPEYRETVQYLNYPCSFLDVGSFGHYNYDLSMLDPNQIYLVDKPSGQALQERGFTVEYFGEVSVAYYRPE